jgi:HSP20 family protein
MVNRSPMAQEFVSLRDAMGQLLEESFTPFFSGTRSAAAGGARSVPLDVYATADEVVIIAAVPGSTPEDVEVSINDGTVTLSGNVQNAAEAQETKGATWFLHELPFGRFRRTIVLPMEVDASRADATFEHGILKIWLPKSEATKPRKIAIRVAPETQGLESGNQNGESSAVESND